MAALLREISSSDTVDSTDADVQSTTHLNFDGRLWNTDALDVVRHVVDNGEAERQTDPDRVEEKVQEDEHASLQSEGVVALAIVGVADRNDTGADGEEE